MARPSSLNEELIEKFAEEIEDGLPIVYTCDLLGITKPSFVNWIKQGEADFETYNESIYALFFTSIKKAYAKYIRKTKNIIRKGENGWQGQAWWLERTNQNFVLNSDNNSEQETVIVNPSIKPNKKQ